MTIWTNIPPFPPPSTLKLPPPITLKSFELNITSFLLDIPLSNIFNLLFLDFIQN